MTAEARTRLDWQEVYAWLERTRRSLAAGGAGTPEQAGQLLRERAQALARPLAQAPPATAVLDLEALAQEPRIAVKDEVGGMP